MDTASTTPAAATRKEIDELDAELGRLSRQANANEYAIMQVIREIDELDGWLQWNFSDGVSWLMWRCDLGPTAARDKLRIARALKDLPLMSAEYARGLLSYSKVRALTRLATADTEEELIDMAHKMSAAHLEQHCRQRRNACKSSSKQACNAHQSRSLRSWRDAESGMMTITLELPIEDGALFEKAIDKAAATLSGDSLLCEAIDPPKQDNKTGWLSLQADAAVALAREYLQTSGNSNATAQGTNEYGGRGSSTADHYQVMLHVDEDALSGRLGDNGTARGKSELPIETIRRLCCDGSIVPIVENAQGEPLNVGRKVRTVTTAIQRALWARDRGCAYPGCNHMRFVDAHHIRHWSQGGETSLDNMVLLCSQHHRLVHEGGYSIQIDDNGKRTFMRADGSVVADCGYHQNETITGPAISISENSAEFMAQSVDDSVSSP